MVRSIAAQEWPKCDALFATAGATAAAPAARTNPTNPYPARFASKTPVSVAPPVSVSVPRRGIMYAKVNPAGAQDAQAAPGWAPLSSMVSQVPCLFPFSCCRVSPSVCLSPSHAMRAMDTLVFPSPRRCNPCDRPLSRQQRAGSNTLRHISATSRAPSKPTNARKPALQLGRQSLQPPVP